MADQRDDSSAHRLAALRDRLHRGMDRREFVRTVASAGYALGVAHLLGVDDFLAASDGDVPIVAALVRSDPEDPSSLEKRTKTVPAEWYAAVTKAFEAHERLTEASVSGYLGSAVEPGGYESESASISVDVSVDDIERASVELDDFLQDVSFDVHAIEAVEELEGEDEEATAPHLAEDIEGDRVPAGVRCENDVAKATLAPALYHPEEETAFFPTAQHAYGEYDDVIGAPLYLPRRGGESLDLGRVRYEHPVEDVVAVEPTGNYRPSSTIQGANPGRVVGQYTRIGLADLTARGETLEKVGAQTERTSGEIDGVDAITCLTDDYCRRGQLRWGREEDMTDGDSGSVCYDPNPALTDDGVLVAGFNNARTWWPGQNYIWGVSAYHLTDQYGYHF